MRNYGELKKKKNNPQNNLIYLSIKMPKHSKPMKPMTKNQHEKFKKAVKDGIISQKQHDNLPAQLLEAIVKSKSKKK